MGLKTLFESGRQARGPAAGARGARRVFSGLFDTAPERKMAAARNGGLDESKLIDTRLTHRFAGSLHKLNPFRA